MKIAILDAYTANPGDLSWAPFERYGECAIYPRSSPSEMLGRCAGATAVIVNKVVLTRETIERLPELRYIGVTATGYNVVDVEAARNRGIVVTNVPGYGTASVAQLVFAFLLEMSNRVAHHSRTVREGRWCSSADFCYWDYPIVELSGRTIGIIGFGEIGSAVATVARAFGMTVLANRRSWQTSPPEGIEAASVERVLRESDVVTLHCPLTEETRHLINTETLNLMKRDAVLINTGRGPLVDETALARVLNEGRIAGAGLDVLSIEPPSADNPLLSARNCIITPHIAWAGRNARERLIAISAANLGAFVRGEREHVVS